jgi:molybdopterin-binding protein
LADGVAVGEAVTVGIRASDIILAAGPLPESSARNTWSGVVSEVQLRAPGYQVSLACGDIVLRCHITGTSLEAMKIEPGMPLWAIFKASSCFLLVDPPDADGPPASL